MRLWHGHNHSQRNLYVKRKTKRRRTEEKGMVEIGWKVKVPVDLKHIVRMLAYPPEYYKKRIQKIGFMGTNKRLLDAACGAGVWAAAASYLNKEVVGIDVTEKYLNVAKDINSKFGRKNLKLIIGYLEKLPYPDKYFDYVVCYDAWMYTNRHKSLQEMYRVLKSDGKIYLGGIAGFGWYLYLLCEGLKKGDRNLIITVLKAIKNRIFMTEYESKKLIEKQGFKILSLAADAQIGDPKIKIKPIFSAKFLGFWNVYEILAQK